MAWAGGEPLEIGLARQAPDHSASERYQGQLVRHRLTKISNEAVNMGVELRKEEILIRRASDHFISLVYTPDGRNLQSTNVMFEMFRQHFQNRFT